jgi:signal transduction histidine kinase
MPTSEHPSVFRAEEELLDHAKAVSSAETESLTLPALHDEYRILAERYAVMLRESTQLTRISDFTQTKLIRLQTQLEKALAESEANLKKAEDANSRKTELLSVVSHDLKSPLASVLAAVQLIEMGDITSEEFPESGARIREICERMLALIESLLASSAMEMGKIQVNKSSCNAKKLLDAVIEQNRLRAQEKDQTLTVSAAGDDFMFYADAILVQQVLENFVSNALKYSPHGASVQTCVQALPETIRFEVQDEGPGFTDDDKQKLFGFFQRLSARPTGGESSHGVGLAITKRVVELHNGQIWVESEQGQGSTFVVLLPRKGEV